MAEPVTLALGVATVTGALVALSRPEVRAAFKGSRAGAGVSPFSGSVAGAGVLQPPRPSSPPPFKSKANPVQQVVKKVKTVLKNTQPNRDLDMLHPQVSKNTTAFLEAVNKAFPQYQMRVGETHRTVGRQQYLFSTNRKGKWVTNCDGVRQISMHQYGLAVDFLLLNPDGSLNWVDATWRKIYATVPPSSFGFETIPQELLHLQLKGSQAQVQSNGRLNPTYLAGLGIKPI